MKYDNRNYFKATKLIASRNQTPYHFMVEINGKKIIYCYIRKNACSAFKNMFIQKGGISFNDNLEKGKIRFLIDNYLARFPWDFAKADHTIFVYRDPIDRIISLFKNKFIEKDGNRDIFRNFFELTNIEPTKCTFRDFITDYLQNEWSVLDVHLHPQSSHLLPIHYTDVIPLSELHRSMIEIVGKKVADEIFKNRTNATKQSDKIFHNNDLICDMQVNEINNFIKQQDGTPKKSNFIDESILECIKSRYKEDFALIDSIGQQNNLT